MLQRLEIVVFAINSPKFWKRYLDDTFVIIKKDNLPVFQQLLKTTLTEIAIKIPSAAENKLPFLDVVKHKLPSGKFETPVYRKATNADIVLHDHSNSQTSH